MEKIEFKGKEFKGSEGEFILREFCMETNSYIVDTDFYHLNIADVYGNDEAGEANARLFANSKNLLKAAIEAHEIIEGLSSLCQSQKEHKEVYEQLQKLETEILKSL